MSEPSDQDADGNEEDNEDESMDDNESVLSDATNKDCTILLNISLFKYFERVFPGTRDMKFKKCQLLILQHILDFNSKFWTNCLGLVFLPKVGQKFWPEDFSKVVGEGKVHTEQTLIQKVMAICDSENKIDLSFRVKSQGGVIHKVHYCLFNFIQHFQKYFLLHSFSSRMTPNPFDPSLGHPAIHSQNVLYFCTKKSQSLVWTKLKRQLSLVAIS